MVDFVRLAFDPRIVWLPMDLILPSRPLSATTRKSVRYLRIAASIEAVGVIEPFVVAPRGHASGSHRLLDGNVRYDILREMAEQQVPCLIARDDEAFTYNRRINPLATVQQHFMIARALNRGVTEERLAKALNLDTQVIKSRRSLLNGICPKVAELLKDRSVNPMIFENLRKMNPERQTDATLLMIAAGNLTSAYARALLAGTKQSDMAQPEKPKKVLGLTAEQMTQMEREMESLHRDLKAAGSSYGSDAMALAIASGYLSKLIGNVAVRRFLNQRYPDILTEFEMIAGTMSPDQKQLI